MTPPRPCRNCHRRHLTEPQDRVICLSCQWRLEWDCDVRRGHSTARAEACVVNARRSPNGLREHQTTRRKLCHTCPLLMRLLDMDWFEYSPNLLGRTTSQSHKDPSKNSMDSHEKQRPSPNRNSRRTTVRKSWLRAQVRLIRQMCHQLSSLQPSKLTLRGNTLKGHPRSPSLLKNRRHRYRSTKILLSAQSKYLLAGRQQRQSPWTMYLPARHRP